MKEPSVSGHLHGGHYCHDVDDQDSSSDEDEGISKLVIDLEASDLSPPIKTTSDSALMATTQSPNKVKVKIRRPPKTVKTDNNNLSAMAVTNEQLKWMTITTTGTSTAPVLSPPSSSKTHRPAATGKKSSKDKSRKECVDPYEFNAKVEDGFGLPAVKRMKMAAAVSPEKSDAQLSPSQDPSAPPPSPPAAAPGGDSSKHGVDIGVMTDPDCLGPCEPGTSVTLEGIIWQETDNGVLVVNVTWKGKTYVGTLLDSTEHHHRWAPPNRRADTPPSDQDSRTPKGRNTRRGRANATTRSQSSATETERRLRSSRRVPSSSFAAFAPPPPSPGNKRKSRDAGAAGGGGEEDNGSGLKAAKRARSSSRSGGDVPKPLSSSPDDWLECPEANCSKRFRNASGLQYHQSHAHSVADEENMETEAEKEKVASKTKDSVASQTKEKVVSQVKETPACAKFVESKDTKVEEAVVVNTDKVAKKSEEKDETVTDLKQPAASPPTPNQSNNNSKTMNNNAPKKKKDKEHKSKSSQPKAPQKKEEAKKVVEVAKVVVPSSIPTVVSQQATKVLMAPLTLAKTVSGTTQVYQLANAPIAAMTVVTQGSLPATMVTSRSLAAGTSTTIGGIPVTVTAVTSSSGNKTVKIVEQVPEDKRNYKMGNVSAGKSVLTVTRPIMPAPGPQIVKVPQTAVISTIAQLKQIQPKPVLVPEQSANPALPQPEKKKAKKKKKSKDKEEKEKREPKKTMVVIAQTVTPPVGTVPGFTHTVKTPASKVSSPTCNKNPVKVVSKVLSPKVCATIAAPVPKVKVTAELAPPELQRQQVTGPQELTTQDRTQTDAHSPAYSDISDANDAAPMLESEVETGKSVDVSKASVSQVFKAGQVPVQSFPSVSSQYGQPPYLTPAVLTATAERKDAQVMGKSVVDLTALVKQEKGVEKSASQSNSRPPSQTLPSPTSHPLPGQQYRYDAEMQQYKLVPEPQQRRDKPSPPIVIKQEIRSEPTSSSSPALAKPPSLIPDREREREREREWQEERQKNENQQILKENMEMSTEMERQQAAVVAAAAQYDQNVLRGRQEEELRRFYMFTQQQHLMPKTGAPATQQQQQYVPLHSPRDQASPNTEQSRSRSRDSIDSRSRSPSVNRKDNTPSAADTKRLEDKLRCNEKMPSPRSTPTLKERNTPTSTAFHALPPGSMAGLPTTTGGQPPFFYSAPFSLPGGAGLPPHLPFDLTRAPLFPGGYVGYGAPQGYLHPGQHPHPSAPPHPHHAPGAPQHDVKALDLLQQQAAYYNHMGGHLPHPPSSHKIHELKDLKPPPMQLQQPHLGGRDSRSVSPAQSTGKGASIDGGDSRPSSRNSLPPRPSTVEGLKSGGSSVSVSSPPPQRHLHTHHHTHVVGPYHPLYGYASPPGLGGGASGSITSSAASVPPPAPPPHSSAFLPK